MISIENFNLLLPNKIVLGEIREIPFGVVGLGLSINITPSLFNLCCIWGIYFYTLKRRILNVFWQIYRFWQIRGKLGESPSGLAFHITPSSWYRLFTSYNTKTQIDNT